MRNDVHPFRSISNQRSYRFYPLLSLVMIRSIATTVIGLALPNYLIFHEHMEAGEVGLIYAIFNITYIAGPIIARPITERIGMKRGLALATFVPILTQGLQLLFFFPGVLILCRGIEGLILGFFWPNAQMQVSLWQKRASPAQSDAFFRSYGYAWNVGCLLGGAVGFFAVILSKNDFFGVVLGWICIVAMVPFWFLCESPKTTLIFEGERTYALPGSSSANLPSDFPASPTETYAQTSQLGLEEQGTEVPAVKIPNSMVMVAIPIVVAYVTQFVHGTIRSVFNFTYPLLLFQAGGASSWTYLVLSIQLIAQMMGINWSSRITPRGKYLWFLVGGIACLLISALIFLNPEIIFISLLNAILGFFNGLLYSLGAQVMLAHGKVTGSLKFATIYEIFSAMGYGISPLVAGFIADVNILWNFELFAIIIALFLVSFAIMTRAAIPKLFMPTVIEEIIPPEIKEST